MQNLPSLYDHQSLVRDKGRTSLADHRGVILCGKPGFGKTRLAKWIMGNTLNHIPTERQSGNSIFAVHRRGLVDNASDSFMEEPQLKHGLIMSKRDTNWNNQIYVASIDTLLAWYCNDGEYESDFTYDLIVYDETHSHLSKLAKWLKPHDKKRKELGLNPTFIIGLSATPEAKGLSDIYGNIVTGPTTEWLIENNYLCPFEYYDGKQGKLNLLVKRGIEFTNDSVSAAMDGLSGDLVRDWKRLGQGRPTVGFFHRRTHAKEAMNLLIQHGVKAQYVDGNTPDDERKKLFKHLGDGTIEYLCNVGIVERGTNIPEISCIQMCTSVGSVVRWHQMLGRGSRTHESKTNCIVIDHGGNRERHGFFEDEIEWTLDNTQNAAKDHEARPTIKCPKCSRAYRGGMCTCGYTPTITEVKSQGLEFDGKELKKVVREKTTTKKKKTCEEIMISALYMAGRSRRTWKQALGIAYGIAKKQGTKFKVPKKVTIAGSDYSMLPYGSPNANRRVEHLYEFTKNKYDRRRA